MQLTSYVRSRYFLHVFAAFLILGSSLFRLSDLGENPSGFFCDEASIGFNALSVLETGKDQYGTSFPAYFRSFGDYKFGTYIYSTALSVGFLGRTNFAVRLPAALFLVGAICVSYLLIYVLVGPWSAITAVFILSFEPWLNHASHIGFSLSAVPLFLGGGVLLFLKGIKRRDCLLESSALPFALAFYTYATMRLFVPLLVGLLFLVHISELKKDRILLLRVGRFVLFLGALMAPLSYYLLNEDGFLERASYLAIFSTPYLDHSAGYQYLEPLSQVQPWLQELLRHDQLKFLPIIVIQYLLHYSPSYLFISGNPNLRFGTPLFGNHLPLTAIGVVLALLWCLFQRKRPHLLIFGWVLLAGIPGALTWEDVPHAGRFIMGSYAISLFAAIGVGETLRTFWALGEGRSVLVRLFCVLTFLLLLTPHFAKMKRYYSYYRTEYSTAASGWMQYGYQESIQYIAHEHEKYQRVVMIMGGLHYLPEIFVLWYSDISPSDWLEEHVLPYHIEIQEHSESIPAITDNTLYVIAPPLEKVPSELSLLKIIHWEDGIGEAIGFYNTE
ncbi:MAG: hypothetical protein KDD70_02195 [Bdellovibrionales bacterium]|nr:hypothetical protein [Bdellovibrionales bacterium]